MGYRSRAGWTEWVPRLVLLLVVLVASFVVAGVRAPEADAFRGYPFVNPGLKPDLNAALWNCARDLRVCPTPASDPLKSTVTGMRSRAAVAAPLRLFSPIGLTATAAVLIGTKVLGQYDRYQQNSGALDAMGGTHTYVTGARWIYGTTNYLGAAGWRLQFSINASCPSLGPSGAFVSSWYRQTPDNLINCTLTAMKEMDEIATLMTKGTKYVVTAGGGCAGGDGSWAGNCYGRGMTEATMAGVLPATRLEPWVGGAGQPQTSPGGASPTSTTYDPASSPTNAQLTEVRQIGHGSGGAPAGAGADGSYTGGVLPEAATGTAPGSAEDDVSDWINGGADSGYTTPPDTVVIPSCAGLTYPQCVLALQAAGYLGTITTVTRTWEDADLAAGANVVLQQSPAAFTEAAVSAPITLTLNPDADDMPTVVPALDPGSPQTDLATYFPPATFTVTVIVLDPLLADADLPGDSVVTYTPGAGTRFPPDTTVPVTVYVNPPMIPAESGPEIAGCECSDLDFGPLSSLDAGTGFPFGVLAWFDTEVIGLFTAGPRAPYIEAELFDEPFDFNGWDPEDRPSPANSALTYRVDLADPLGGARDDFLVPLHDMIHGFMSWILWAGAIWLCATKVLNWKFAGDPGSEAMDDVTAGMRVD